MALTRSEPLRSLPNPTTPGDAYHRGRSVCAPAPSSPALPCSRPTLNTRKLRRRVATTRVYDRPALGGHADWQCTCRLRACADPSARLCDGVAVGYAVRGLVTPRRRMLALSRVAGIRRPHR